MKFLERNMEIVEMFRSGMRYVEIAKYHGISDTRIKEILKKHLTDSEIKKMKSKRFKKTAQKIAERYLSDRKL